MSPARARKLIESGKEDTDAYENLMEDTTSEKETKMNSDSINMLTASEASKLTATNKNKNIRNYSNSVLIAINELIIETCEKGNNFAAFKVLPCVKGLSYADEIHKLVQEDLKKAGYTLSYDKIEWTINITWPKSLT